MRQAEARQGEMRRAEARQTEAMSSWLVGLAPGVSVRVESAFVATHVTFVQRPAIIMVQITGCVQLMPAFEVA